VPFTSQLASALLNGRHAVVLVVFDAEGVVRSFNPAAEEISGYRADEIVGERIWDVPFQPDEMKDSIEEVMRRFRDDDVPLEPGESDWVTRDGRRVPVAWRSTAVTGDDGVRYAVATGIPLSEVRGAEAQAERERKRLEAFLSALPDIFFVIDSEGVYLDVSAPNASLLAAPKEQLLGTRIHQWLPFGFAERVMAVMQTAQQTGEVQEMEYALDLPVGERFFKARFSPESEGRTILIIRDVTAEREARVEAERARDAAQSASRAKSTFLATMSHEIRTPLNGIIGFSNLLLEDPELGREHRGFAQTIAESGRRLLDLLNDVLDLAKIEAGRITPVEEEVDIEGLCTEIIDAFAAEAARKGLRFELAVDPRLPRRGILDGRRFQQVMSNLISNAVKFTDHGFVRLDIGTVEQNGQLRLRACVEDSGRGIPPQDHQRVFEPFEQAIESELDREHGGTGLGLAISRELAQFMNGTLELESTPGEGSCFTLEVPLPLPTATRVVRSVPARPSLGTMDGLSVLVVDNTQTNRQLYGSQVARWGAEVITVETGREALELLTTRTFDLIMLDYNMPGMSGVDVAQAVRSDSRHDDTPLLLISSVDTISQQDMAVFDDAVVKPVPSDKLFATIEQLVGSDRAKPSGAEQVAAPLPPGVARGTILVVEDEQMNARLLQRILERAGYEAHVAANGIEALERLAAAETAYDAILLDVMMPQMDGLTLMRRLHAEQPDHPPVVVVSARAFEQQRQEMLDAGAAAYITKPVYRDELFSALHSVLPARPHALPAAENGASANGTAE
jgi:PAS domain S-box-containing protein